MAETTSNEEVAQAVIESPDAENVTKAIRRGISVSDILNNERDDWLERHRGVVIKRKTQLGHPHVHKTFTRYFSKMSQYLFFIPVMGRVLVLEKNHNDVLAVESSVIKAMEGAISKLDELIGQYQAAILAHSIPEGDYNKSYEIEVSFASPLDKLYYQVLEKSDLCLMLNYNLWVENALNPDYRKNELHRTENEWEVKTLIKNVNYQTIVNYRRLLNSINRDQRSTRESSVPAPQVAKAAKVVKAAKVAEVVEVKAEKKAKVKTSEVSASAAVPA